MENMVKKVKTEEAQCNVVPVLDDIFTRTVDLVNVYVSTIQNPKDTSKVVKELCRDRPLKRMTHLKRVKSNSKGDTGSMLQIIVSEDKDDCFVDKTWADMCEQNKVYQYLSKPYTVKVPLNPPLTRQQYNTSVQFWPCSFHEDKKISRLLDGSYFSKKDIEIIKENMESAILVGQKSEKQPSIGAVIVDPVTNCILARACDLRHGQHPLQHAVMVAIDLVASVQGGGMWDLIDHPSLMTSSVNEQQSVPYLCTGYDLYVTREPCIMCAMALVHSRISRVFYSASHSDGALGSKYKLHVQPGINHHYEVFQVQNIGEGIT